MVKMGQKYILKCLDHGKNGSQVLKCLDNGKNGSQVSKCQSYKILTSGGKIMVHKYQNIKVNNMRQAQPV